MSTIGRGKSSIGFGNAVDESLTQPSLAQNPDQVIAYLMERMNNLETIAEGKADSNKIRTLIAFSDEAILIKAQDIAIAGNVTFIDVLNEYNGTTNGEVPNSITRIIGDRIQTGIITSNNYGASEGSAYNLNDGTIIIGGTDNPSLEFAGGNLTISGRLTAESVVLTKSTTVGEMADDIADSVKFGDFGGLLDSELAAGVGAIAAGQGENWELTVDDNSVFARHKDFDELGTGSYSGDLRSGLLLTGAGIALGYNKKSDGAFVPAVSINATGDISILGTLTAGSVITGSVTVDGTQLTTIKNQAADALPASSFDSTLNNSLAAGVGSVAAGQGTNYLLDVTNTSVYARHKDFSDSSVGAYAGDLRTGLLLTGSGIAMGYNRKSDGNFIPAVSIDATGDISILGTLTAGSIITGSVTVDGVQLSTVRSYATTGANLSTALTVSGTTILRGTLQPDTSGAIRTGTITWNSSTGALTGGTGVALTQWGIIGANAGNPTFSIQATTGSATFAGTVAAGSIITGSVTTDGVALSTVRTNASTGKSISDTLLLAGTATLRGVIQPDTTGAIRTGTITWNTSTGALTGGTGIAITQWGIIGASSGAATFTIQASTGVATFRGDVITSGQVLATGATSTSLGSACLVGETSINNRRGVLGISTGNGAESVGVQGFCGGSNGSGVIGNATNTTSKSVIAAHSSASGAALEVQGGGIIKSNVSNHRLDVYDDVTNSLVGSFRYRFYMV